jgi:hypothetical protein
MFIVPLAGHAIMIEAGEIVSDVINDFLIKLDPHLSHAWQLSYTAGEKWSLKNEQKVPHPSTSLTAVEERSKRVRKNRHISPPRNEGAPPQFQVDSRHSGKQIKNIVRTISSVYSPKSTM